MCASCCSIHRARFGTLPLPPVTADANGIVNCSVRPIKRLRSTISFIHMIRRRRIFHLPNSSIVSGLIFGYPEVITVELLTIANRKFSEGFSRDLRAIRVMIETSAIGEITNFKLERLLVRRVKLKEIQKRPVTSATGETVERKLA